MGTLAVARGMTGMTEMEAYIMKCIDLVKMEGFPVEHDCDILLKNLVVGGSRLIGLRGIDR